MLHHRGGSCLLLPRDTGSPHITHFLCKTTLSFARSRLRRFANSQSFAYERVPAFSCSDRIALGASYPRTTLTFFLTPAFYRGIRRCVRQCSNNLMVPAPERATVAASALSHNRDRQFEPVSLHRSGGFSVSASRLLPKRNGWSPKRSHPFFPMQARGGPISRCRRLPCQAPLLSKV